MEEYPDFVESTGYGTGGGLSGWNCRHNIIPFNPETMTNNLEQYGLEENEDMYLNHQKQRYFERNIRKYKRQSEILKTSLTGIKDEETHNKLYNNLKRKEMLIKKWNKAYKKFSKEKEIRTQPERLKIAT
jgi:hypothetical protein